MYIKVQVYAGMKKEQVTRLKEHHFEIVTKAPARGNAANRKIRELIAAEYGVPDRHIRLVSGHHHPNKILEVIKNVTT